MMLSRPNPRRPCHLFLWWWLWLFHFPVASISRAAFIVQKYLTPTTNELILFSSVSSSSSSIDEIIAAKCGVGDTQHNKIPTTASRREGTRPSKVRIKNFDPRLDDEDRSQLSESNDRTRLIQLSSNPLLFRSEEQILTADECQSLIDWCQKLESNGQALGEVMNSDDNSAIVPDGDGDARLDVLGRQTLWKLQRLIHHSILGMAQSSQDYVVPRYLHYHSNSEKRLFGYSLSSETAVTVDQLLPDGLHVDTNNGKHFRHWTVLVYLDSPASNTLGGATTFPLAEGMQQDHCQSLSHHDDGQPSWHSDAKEAAANLLLNYDLHHTRLAKDEFTQRLGSVIEECALHLYLEELGSLQQRQQQQQQHHQQPEQAGVEQFQDKRSRWHGLRVLPRQGHVCLFSSLTHNGFPNPLSFHAGEAVLSGEQCKNVLSFFYEIPTELFSDRQQFAEQVRTRDVAFLNFHGLGG